MQQDLIEQGNFLTLSRTRPELFSSPSSFSLEEHTRVAIPAEGIICFEPMHRNTKSNKHIVLSCGVHGNETAPIEICDELVKQLLTGKLTAAHRVMFLFGNLPAMDTGERFIKENMNRLFSGAHSQGPGLCNDERRRAQRLEQEVSAFFAKAEPDEGRYHYDLHTAIRPSKNEKFAVYPYLHERRHSRSQLAFLAACGVKTILLSESSTTTFSYYSSHVHNAHAFTVELGMVKPFGENDMSRFEQTRQSLVSLVSKETFSPDIDLCDLDIYRVNQVINRQAEDFALHFSDDIPNFTDFPEGTLLATETGKAYKTLQDNEAIVFPNANVAIGQRALLTVVPTNLEKLDV